MTFARRLRLDLHPPLIAQLALWMVLQGCAAISQDDYPWSVDSAFYVGGWITSTWWLWSDSIRRGEALLPVWGLYFSFAGGTVLPVYILYTRGWWGWLTLLLYTFLFLGTGLLIQSIFANGV